MSELEKINQEFEKRKEELQFSCSHTELSDWVEEWWAIGHSTGYLVKYCERCGKTVHRKTSCWKCGKEIIDDAIKEGDGSENFPLGASYCPECRGVVTISK